MNSASSESFNRDWADLKLVGGCLCLDFINTVDRETNGYSHDWLTEYADLVAWGQQTGTVTAQQAKHLLQKAQQQPDRANAIFDRAIQLRETLHRIFSKFSARQSPQAEDLAQFNSMLIETHAHLQLVFTENQFAWSWNDSHHLKYMLWQVIRSAEELLTNPNLNRVRECAGTDCGWVFLDMSRNRSRRWCDMEDCGNRAKARRHYERSKE
jgi:predicted RNA-binding Zn ribbon-like protein